MKAFEADIVSTLLATCGRCAGTGRINYMGNWSPCPNCKGSGKI
jgi:DnaJ-class molecular chaperone